MRKYDELVQCPYYQKDGKQAVHCEGVSRGNRLHLYFNGNSQRDKYKAKYCKNGWKECCITKMLNLKYDYCP